MCATVLNVVRGVVGRASLVFIMSVVGCGCSMSPRKPPTPPAPPELKVETISFVGSPLSGPTTAPAPRIDVGTASRIDVTWVALEKVPSDALLPLDAQSRLTSAPLSAGPVLNVGQNTRSMRFGEGERAGTFVAAMRGGTFGAVADVVKQTALMVPGVSAQFQCAPSGTAKNQPREITLTIARGVTGQKSNPTTQPGDGVIAIGIDSADETGQEIALLDGLVFHDNATFALLIPCEITGTPWRALVADITVRNASDDSDSAAAVEQLRKDLGNASASGRPVVAAGAAHDLPAMQSAIAALRRNGDARPSLLFLSRSTGARIAGDFTLVAEDARIAALRDQFLAIVPADATPAEESLRWMLDRSALLVMSEPTEDKQTSPEIASVLMLYTGELGRQPDSIREIVKTVGSSTDFQTRVVGENLIALEDSSPGARVRAFDWLQRQGKAPPGFDPMGDRKSRRDAINRMLPTASNGGAQ